MFVRTSAQTIEKENNFIILGAVSSQASRGIGLWTSICLGFAHIFGTKCKHYSLKIEIVKKEALDSIIEEAELLGADGIIDLRYAFSGLSVIASGTAIKQIVKHKQPKPAPIEKVVESKPTNEPEAAEALEPVNNETEAVNEEVDEEQPIDEYAKKCLENIPSRTPRKFLEYVLYYLAESKRGLTPEELIRKKPDLITKAKLHNTQSNGFISLNQGKYYLTETGFSFLKKLQ